MEDEIKVIATNLRNIFSCLVNEKKKTISENYVPSHLGAAIGEDAI